MKNNIFSSINTDELGIGALRNLVFSNDIKDKKKIKLSTGVAYAIISNVNRYIYTFILLSAFAISFSIIFPLGFSIADKFSYAFNLAFAAAQDSSRADINSIQQAFVLAWSNALLFAICIVSALVLMLLIAKIFRIYIEFNKRKLFIVPLSKKSIK